MEKRPSSNRILAFSAIVFSTVAVTGCLLAFPLIFHYIQTLEASVHVELDFCRTRSRDMWNEMMDIHHGNQVGAAIYEKQNESRPKRNEKRHRALKFWADQLLYDQPVTGTPKATTAGPVVTTPGGNSAAPVATGAPKPSGSGAGICCTCHRGIQGPPGPPGLNGADGALGPPGQPGERGDPAPSDQSILDRFPKQCPCQAPPGDPGPLGPKGPDGPAGDAGLPGTDGKPGAQGAKGSPGENAKPGLKGDKGPLGDPGKVNPKPGSPGAAGGKGKPGTVGPPGQAGQPGKDGAPGKPGGNGDPGPIGPAGKPGNPGPDGDPGKIGDPGSCTHCPPARLAPGY